jgi:hypothetical protein
MELARIESFPGSKVYFTEADSLAQQFYRISKGELRLKLKLWLLLSDYVMLSAAHIFESPITFELLRDNPVLLESGIVVPNLRHECRDYLDFIEVSKERGDLSSYYRDRADEIVDIASFLQDHTPKVLVWTPAPVSDAFRQSLVNDLLDRGSPLRRKLLGIKRRSLEKLTWEIGNTRFLTRERIINLSNELLGNRRFVLLKHATLLYYLCGASYRQSEPVIHHEALNWYKEKFSHLSQALNIRGNEYAIFRDVLDEFSISKDILERLSMPKLLELRGERVAKRFRTKWNIIVQKVRRNVDTSADAVSYHQVSREFKAMLLEAVGVEKRKKCMVQRGRKALIATSIMTSLLTWVMSHPAVSIISLLIELASIDPLLAAIERKWGGLEFIFLFSRLQEVTPD